MSVVTVRQDGPGSVVMRGDRRRTFVGQIVLTEAWCHFAGRERVPAASGGHKLLFPITRTWASSAVYEVRWDDEAQR